MVTLIIREEIVCIIVLIFLLCYNFIYNDKGRDNSFMRITSIGLMHVILDMITVITVNNQVIVPDMVNRVLHILFYISGMGYIMEFYKYILRLTFSHSLYKKLCLVGDIPFVFFTVILFLFPMEYVSGNGTEYSYGPLVFIGYGLFAVYCFTSLIIVLVKRNKVENKIKLAVIPMLLVMAAMIATQAVIPELLMTGAGITMVCIGLFVTCDNPAKMYMEQTYWDATVGVKNKNGYKKDLDDLKRKYLDKNKELKIGFVLGDMNGLKVINDNYGHAEGDKMISAAAHAMLENMRSAYSIYRTGGDEFVAVYLFPNDNIVKEEIEKTRRACEKYTYGPVILSIAMGYASGIYTLENNDIYDKADKEMYIDKAEIKKQHPELIGRK